MQEYTGISIKLMKPLLMVFWSFFVIYLFCELGERVSSQFDELSDAIYQSEWYEFPMDVRRVLPILMMAAQKQVVPRGFGNLLCTREFFKKVTISFILWLVSFYLLTFNQFNFKVVNTGFSYFLVIRELYWIHSIWINTREWSNQNRQRLNYRWKIVLK